jgi:hypothetical protein
MTRLGALLESDATVYENAYSEGPSGGLIAGQTLLRATGLTVPSKIPHSDSVFTYTSLKARKPCSVNGAGERNSQAQNAVSGRPLFLIASATNSNPPTRGTGRRNRTRCIR